MSKSATRIHKHSVRRQDSSALGVGLGTCDESAMPCSENGRVSSNAEENSVPKSGTSQKFGHDSVNSMNSIDKTGCLKSVRADLAAHQRSAFGKGEISESTALHRGRPGRKSIGQREFMNFFAYETLVVVVAALVVVMLGLVMSLAHLHASFQDLEKNMRSAQQCCQRNEELFQDLAKELRATNGFAFANNNNHNHNNNNNNNNNNNVLIRLAQNLDEAEENRQSKRPSNRPKIPIRGITQGENAVPKLPQTQFQTSDETVTEGLESPVEDQLRDSGPSMSSPEMSLRLTIIGNGDNDEQSGVVINDDSFEIDEDIDEDFEEYDEDSFENEDEDDVEEEDDQGQDEGNQQHIISGAPKDEKFQFGPSSRLGSNSDEAVPGQESWGHSGEPFVEPSAPESQSKDSQPLSRHVREIKSLSYTFDEMMKEIMKNMDERQKKLDKTYNKKLKGIKKSVQKAAIQSDRFVWNFENSVDYQTHLTLTGSQCKWLHSSENKWNTSFQFCQDRTFTLDEDYVSIPFHVETDITERKMKKHRLVLSSHTPGVFEVQQAGLYLVQFNVTILDEMYNHSLALFLNDYAMLSCPHGGFPCPHANHAFNSKRVRICNIDGLLVLQASDKIDIRTLQPKTKLRVEDQRMSFLRFVMLEPAKSERKSKRSKKAHRSKKKGYRKS